MFVFFFLPALPALSYHETNQDELPPEQIASKYNVENYSHGKFAGIEITQENEHRRLSFIN